MSDLVGKTIASIEKEMYGLWIKVGFDDGTAILIKPVTEFIHNERWSAVMIEDWPPRKDTK